MPSAPSRLVRRSYVRAEVEDDEGEGGGNLGKLVRPWPASGGADGMLSWLLFQWAQPAVDAFDSSSTTHVAGSAEL
eukprot:COSAG05_NODE_15353_length_372_cov_0.553114_1_plen_75_part_01